MKKRVFILILMAAVILTLLPTTTVMAAAPDEHLPFDVTGGTYGVDWDYEWDGYHGTLKLITSNSFHVSMKSGVTQTTTDKISVFFPTNAGLQDIVLDGVNIDVSGTFIACALDIRPGAGQSYGLRHDVSITLAGTSSLKSGYGVSGVHVPETAFVTFQGSGSLTATGGTYGAGIGGEGNETSGNIQINSGNITATGGSSGAGIGGGSGGSACTISVRGGSVYASGGDGAKDIGSGAAPGSYGALNINSASALVYLRNDRIPQQFSSTTHIHKTFTGVHAGDIVFGGVTLPWDGDYGAYLPLCAFAYDANGGSGTTPDPIEQLVGTSTTITVAGGSGILREHYAFAGWNTHADGSGTAYTPGSSVPFTFSENVTLYAQWTPIDYFITFDSREGSLVPNQYISILSPGTVVRPGDPTRDYYDFDNWYTEPECENLYNFGAVVSSNLTLYAKWYPHQYEITYNLDGGVNDSGNPAAYTIESDDIPLVQPTKANFDFAGWSGTDVTGVKRSVTIPKGSTGNREYTAHWNATGTRVVTFDSQGGSAVAPKTVRVNTLVAVPTAPVKSGYSLKGWYREPECINVWNFSTNKVTDNITLYAKWAPRTYTVTFDSRGGSAVHYASVVYDTLVTKPAEPTRYGYKFDNWYKDSACTNIWAFDTDHMPAKNITLYAKWNIHQWKVTFNSQGGSEVTPLTGVAYYSLIPAPLIPSKTHYTFKGWYKNETCTSPWYFSSSRTPDRDLTLYVKWAPETFKVTFNSLGGSRVYSKTAGWDTLITKPANPTRTGHIFGGWYKDVSWTDDWDFSADKVYAATTLYAKWTPRTYTVTFNANGGTIDGSPTTEVLAYYGTAMFMPSIPEREGYYFGGWYTSKYFTTQWKFEVTKNMTLYAKWMTAPYKITFKANASGVTNLPAPIYAEYFDRPLEPAEPTKAGYTFKGWYRSSTYFTDANRYRFDGGFVTGSVTLYARWVPSQYKVTFNAMGGATAPPAQTVPIYGLVTKPTDPVKAGYFFGGWYTSSTSFTSANEWAFDTRTVTKNVTLYARWRNKLNAPRVTIEDKAEDRIVITLSTDPYATWYGVNKYNSAGQYLLQYESVSNVFTLTGDDLTPGETYFFEGYVRRQVGSTNFGGCSKAVPENPGRPGSVTAEAASYNTIRVKWSDSGIYRNTGYEVWRATSLNGTYTKVGTTASTVLSFDNKVYTGKTYYYKVRAFRQTGTAKAAYGAFSDIVSKKATLGVPGSFIAGGSGATSVTALWNAVEGASGYELWRATADSGVFKLLKTITSKTGMTSYSYKNTGLVTDQPYYYKVRAYRIVGDRKVYSGFTDVIIATPSDF